MCRRFNTPLLSRLNSYLFHVRSHSVPLGTSVQLSSGIALSLVDLTCAKHTKGSLQQYPVGCAGCDYMPPHTGKGIAGTQALLAEQRGLQTLGNSFGAWLTYLPFSSPLHQAQAAGGDAAPQPCGMDEGL